MTALLPLRAHHVHKPGETSGQVVSIVLMFSGCKGIRSSLSVGCWRLAGARFLLLAL